MEDKLGYLLDYETVEWLVNELGREIGKLAKKGDVSFEDIENCAVPLALSAGCKHPNDNTEYATRCTTSFKS